MTSLQEPQLRIGERLVRERALSGAALERGLEEQRQRGGRLGDALVRLGLVRERTLLAELARQHGVPFVEIGDRSIPPEAVQAVPARLIRSRKVIPIARAVRNARGLLVVATTAPHDLRVLDELAAASGQAVQFALAADEDIERAIERHLPPRA